MQGQWLGRVEGETTGNLIVDLDDCYDHFRGTARLFASGEPGVICELSLPKDSTSHDLHQVPLMWMPEGRPMIVSRDQIAELAPGMTFPATARIKLNFAGQKLSAEWQSDIGTGGKATLKQSQADKPSSIEPFADVQTWQKFKEFALRQEPGKFIFRGQPEAFRLRTAFHRTHRKDLVRYVAEDIPLAYKMLTARTRHLFDLSKSDQLGAFWNLLQHHGYPTPLLDWTYSPFVAAFFAYRRRPRTDAPSDKIRIFAFDKEAWTKSFNQLQAVNFAEIHFSILEALAIENQRAIPQQALSTLTNADDIETYISDREKDKDVKFLHAIDLPAASRREVMVELAFMGITAGSLFPGLDGACEELRGRMFHQQLAG